MVQKYHHVCHTHRTMQHTNTLLKVHKCSTRSWSCKYKNNWTACAIVCLQAYFHKHKLTALGQGDSGSSEPAVTCRSRCSGKPLLTATIDDLIKLSPRRSAAGGGEVGMVWLCGSGVRAGGGEISRRPCACLPLVQIESDSLNSEKASFFPLSK